MKVLDTYQAPFGKIPELRLSNVPRWGIVKMSKKQSVAEHSFNVAAITSYLCNALGMDDEAEKAEICDALWHDYDEIFTGDIPTTAKVKQDSHPTIVKLADLLESYAFCDNHCTDTKEIKNWVLKPMYNKIIAVSDYLEIPYEVYSEFMEGGSHV